MEYKLNQKIWHIEINNAVKEERDWRPNGVNVKELKIIGISPYKVCLNNDWFTSLDYEKDGEKKDKSYKTYLDDVSVSIRTRDNVLGDGVFVSMYSTKEPSQKILDRMVAKASNKIDKEYGFLFDGVKSKLWDMVQNYKL